MEKEIKTSPGDYKFLIIILCATFLIIIGMIFLNDIVVSIRMLELKTFLRDSDKKASDMSTVGMVSKFKLHKKLYENIINEDELNKKEYNTMYNTLSSEDHQDILLTKYQEIAPTILTVMNLIRICLRKPPIEFNRINKENIKLTLAYYTERQKKYNRALEIYNELLSEEDVDVDQIHIILLHQGYCLSIIGEYDRAKEKYLEIIKTFENEDVAITAARLLRYIEELESEVQKVKESDDSPLQKSEKLYKLIAFKEALEILEKVVVEEDESSEKVEYLKARCYEETGSEEESVKIYQDIIDNSIDQKVFDADTAKQANQRILLVSTIAEEGEKIKELSLKNNELIADPDFPKLLDTASKLATAYKEEENRIRENQDEEKLETEPTPEGIAESIETFTEDKGEEPGESESSEEEFEEFLVDSLKNVEEKIVKLIDEEEITPAPTPSPTPVPTPTKRRERRTPTPKKTPEATVEKTPEATVKKGAHIERHIDDLGNIVKEEEFGETGSLLKVKEFNDDGKISKVEQYDEVTGEMIGYFMYEFDEQGNPVKVYAYNSDGDLIEE